MISLGNISRNIMFRDDAAAVLAVHTGFVWNKAGTRIRCTAEACAVVLDVPAGPGTGDAALAYARHQAEQLPEPFDVRAEPDAPAAAEVLEPVSPPEPTSVEPEPKPIEPAGEPVETEDKPAKTRRDTKALQTTIAELTKGDRVTAFFNHPRYGQFAVEGTVLKGGAGLDRNQLSVGGWYINLNERAAKYLQELIIVAPAGKHEFAIPKPSESTEHVGIGG